MSKPTKSLPWIISFALAAVLTGPSASALAAIRYVNAARPDDSGNGLSWSAAKKTLQAALASAAGGDEIWVAAGTYKPDQGGGQVPGNRSATFQLLSGVSIYGGFAGGEVARSQRDIAANPTVLSGDLAGNDSPVGCVFDSDCLGSLGDNCLDGTCNISAGNGENSFHVVTGTSAPVAILDGFTVTAGNANSSAPNNRGGGMTINGGSPSAANCLFTRNFAIFGGGGMYNSSNGATVTSCTFLGNTCGNGGGGGGSGGGGMVVHSASNATIVKCTFRDNVSKGPGGGAGGDGGGLNITGGSSYSVLNCAFFGNRAATGGGMAISSAGGPTINSAFSGNSADSGGALHLTGGSGPTLTNCTLSRNIASSEGGGIYTSGGGPTFRSSILWENSDAGGMDESAQIHTASGTPLVVYSIVQGGWTGAFGPGNIASNPLFIDANGPDNIYGTLDDDLGLMHSSQAIDSANNGHLSSDFADLDGDGDTAEPIPIDLAGNARQVDDPFAQDTGSGPAPIVDMGAYERQASEVIVYVDAGATGANNGLSWADAFVHLQGALSLASSTPSITEIWVAGGTYMPDGGRTPTGGAHVNGTGNRTATFQLLDGVALYGGFAGGETLLTERDPALNATTLSGDLLDNDGANFANYSENAFHVITISGTDATALLDGFTVTGGNANSTGDAAHGGGCFSSAGGATLRSCRFVSNRANGVGGGVALRSGSEGNLDDCVFELNQAFQGAGFAGDSSSTGRLSGCTFRSNAATNGGGGAALQTDTWVVSESVFLANVANGFGGGASLVDVSPATFVNCRFLANQSAVGGGVASIAFDPTAATFVNSQFVANSALGGVGGGALHCADNACTNVILVNCTLHANTALAGDGGGVRAQSGAGPSLRNCVLWGNMDQGGMDSGAQIEPSTATPGVFFSTVQGGWTGAGLSNLSSDPLFFDPDGLDNIAATLDDNLRLRPGSPAINTGNTLFVPGDTADLDGDGNTGEQTPLDLDKNPRLVGMADQGPYEFFTDCNSNGVPDSTDIALGTSQDCDGGGKFWQQNGIPDECDIADCPKPESCVGGIDHGQFCTFDPDCDSGDCAGAEFYGCQDCNLNGVLDACDINGATSQDSDFNGIPDECGAFTGGCTVVGEEPFWTCAENWDLSGQYPDDVDSAGGISVNLPDGSIVVLDESVTIPNLHILNGAELKMITHDTSLDVHQTIQVDGTLTMESCKIAGNTPPVLTIRSGGKFQTTPCTSSGDPSTMTATEIRILDRAWITQPLCLPGGSMEITDSLSMTATGDFIIDGSLSGDTIAASASDGAVAGGRTPPQLRVVDSPLVVEGSMLLVGAVIIEVSSAIPVEVGGDFDNQLVRPGSFQWLGGALNMTGTGAVFEAAGSDLGSTSLVSEAEFGMGAISIAPDADVAFQDNFDNDASGQLPCTEAVYVNALTLGAGAVVSIDNCRIYYNSLTADPSATVTFTGCGDLVEMCSIAAAPELAQHDGNAGAPVSLVDLRNNRYLAIRAPASAGRQQAIRVHLKTLPPPWDAWNASKLFVTAPTTACEISGVGPGQNCGAAPTFQLAGLSCDPADAAFLDWTTIPGGVVYVSHPGIVPSSASVTAEYEVQMIDGTCDTSAEAQYSPVKTVLGVKWGDVCGGYDPSGPYYVAANGTVDVAVDVTAALNKFANRPGAPIKARVDVEPCALDGKINITDVTRILDGFRNLPFPFTPGGGFGCASADPCAYSAMSSLAKD